MKLEFSGQILDKDSNIKFHENPSCGSRVAPRRRKDGQTDMMQLVVGFSQFCERAKKKKWSLLT
jgi:hypothetical protein